MPFPVILSTQNNHIINFLNSSPPDINLLQGSIPDPNEKINSDYGPRTFFQLCCLNGKLEHLKILSWDISTREKAIQYHEYEAIELAAENGHTETLKYLLKLIPDKQEEVVEVIKQHQYFLIETVTGGTTLHPETLKCLFNLMSNEQKKEAVRVREYTFIFNVIRHGDIATLKYLLKLIPNEQNKVVEQEHYKSIRMAAAKGYTNILAYLFNTYLTGEEHQKEKLYSVAFFLAARNGHTKTIKYLERYLTQPEREEIIKKDNYQTIRDAVGTGSVEAIEYLKNYLTTAEWKEAVTANDYQSIAMATEFNHHIGTIRYLLEQSDLTPQEQIEAIITNEYYAIRRAAIEGHAETINYLETYLTIEQKKQAADYVADYAASIITYYHSHPEKPSDIDPNKQKLLEKTEDNSDITKLEESCTEDNSDITKLDAFCSEQKDRLYNNKSACDEIDVFKQKAISIILSEASFDNKRKELTSCAGLAFHHRHWGRRLAADALLLISSFALVGSVVGLARVLNGHSFFFCAEKTTREQEFGILADSMDLGNKNP